MGVYIKGKSKPDKCAYCAMGRYYYENGRLWCNAENKIVAEIPYEDRLLDSPLTNIDIPSWCPLVEVAEPHGNLVDISLMSERAKYWDVGFNGISLHDLLQEFMPFAQIATVIEAEGE